MIAGCKENTLIDRYVTQDSEEYKRILSMACIIEFAISITDTTSHELIVQVLGCLPVDDSIVQYMKQLTPLWKNGFTLTTDDSLLQTELRSFKREVFQKTSLSAWLFSISLLQSSLSLDDYDFLLQWHPW